METLDDVRAFMEFHVFAVLDFMSLLKCLQQHLTSVRVPWTPQGDPAIRRMINEIVLGEETDDVVDGRSHFEWYVEAMDRVGADTGPIRSFVDAIDRGATIDAAFRASGAPAAAVEFVDHTLRLCRVKGVHEIAAAFTVGRENLIPEMFPRMIEQLAHRHTEMLAPFMSYLQRHVDVDGGDHGPLSERMLERLCGDDQIKWHEVENAAVSSLESRLALWDGAHTEMQLRRPARMASA